jgi:hypothetical protein
MKKMLSTFTLLALLAPFGASAENLEEPALGYGSRLCKDWTASRATGGLTSALARQWLYGYLSGYDAFGRGGRGLFFAYDLPGIVEVVDRECARNPSRPIANVAYDFVNAQMQPPHTKPR